jgi:hypothetical protein
MQLWCRNDAWGKANGKLGWLQLALYPLSGGKLTSIWRIVTGNRFLPAIALRTCEGGLSLIFGRSWWQ